MARFERDLIDYLKYAVLTDRERRARWPLHWRRASLNFGLGNIAPFAWVGSFSSTPNTKPPAELLPDGAAARTKS